MPCSYVALARSAGIEAPPLLCAPTPGARMVPQQQGEPWREIEDGKPDFDDAGGGEVPQILHREAQDVPNRVRQRLSMLSHAPLPWRSQHAFLMLFLHFYLPCSAR